MRQEIKRVKSCRICKSKKLYRFLDLGSMPIPNGFLSKDDLKKPESKFELACFFCENCGLVQLTNVVSPHKMFSNYLYIPSTARVMLNNFSNLSYSAHKHLRLNEKTLVIDIGSNDGTLLTFFKRFGTKVLGIDPAKNLAQVARMNGISTEARMFNLKTAQFVKNKYGQSKLITATNVVAHIDNLHQLLGGVSHLLSKDGLFITEFPYHLDLMHKNEFDTIYHEHLSYFSMKPWKLFIEKFGFEISDAIRLPIHGGSIRLVHRKKKSKKSISSKTINYLISLEERLALYDKKTYDLFAHKVMKLKETLLLTLRDLKRSKKKIVGYGAAAKGNVLTNFFGIGPKTLDFIVDSTPYKQGLFTPGMHIPIYAEDRLLSSGADYALILAWNFADEIMEKQKEFKKRGGKFIIPIPQVRII